MGTMREMVNQRVESLGRFHQRSKETRYGYLVRPLTLILGWTVFIVGLITIPLPGQGWLTTFLGIGILSLEQQWARSFLAWGVHQYDRFFDWYRRQNVKTRVMLIALLIIIIWVTFIVAGYITWRIGWAPWLDPFARWIGLSH